MNNDYFDQPGIIRSVDDLAELMAEVNREFAAEEQSIRISKKRRCKIGGMLLRVKDKVGHGNFKDYIAKNFKGSYPTANRWMNEAKALREKPIDSMDVDDLEALAQKSHNEIFDSASDATDKTSEIQTEHQHGDESENNSTYSVTAEDENSYPSPDTKAELANQEPTSSPNGDSCLCTRCERIGKPSCDECRAKDEKRKEKTGEQQGLPDPKPRCDGPVDDAGEPIPEHVREAFATTEEIMGVCRDINAVIKTVGQISKGPGSRLISFSVVTRNLRAAKGNLRDNRATHVCPYCHGIKNSNMCKACKDEGWVAKHIWDQASRNNERGKR
jgi:hypothetical protein